MRAIHLILSLFLLFTTANGQNDTKVFFGLRDSVLSNSVGAIKYIEFKRTNDNLFQEVTYLLGKKKWENQITYQIKKLSDNSFAVSEFGNKNAGNFLRLINETKNSQYYIQDFYENGKIKQEGWSKTIFPLVKIGKWTRYSEDDYKLAVDFYADNLLVKNIRYNQDGTKDFSDVHYIADEMPCYRKKSFDDFKYNYYASLKYPEYALAIGTQGEVILEFVVMEDGHMDGIKIIKSADNIFNEEALRNLQSYKADWIPGKINGNPVKVLYTIPVHFILQQ